MFFLAPYFVALQILGNNPVDGSWALAIAVTGFGFLFWQYLKSIRDDIKEIDTDVKEIKVHMGEQDAHLHKQDLVIMKIKTHLKIAD